LRSATRAVALCSIACLGIAPGIASAAGTISGTVEDCTPQSGCRALAGAVVTVAGPDQPPVTATTDSNGRYSRPVDGNGPFGVGVQAKGFAGQSVAGVPAAGPPVDFGLGPAEFTPLPVFEGGAATATDARSGIFYALASFAPEVYRSVDYGGSWQPVTMSYDDPGEGLRTTVQKDRIATSSVSGEVAIAQHTGPPLGNSVVFSTDYGLTWRTVGGDAPPVTGPPRRLFWAHASVGAPSVLVVAQPRGDGGWDVWRADMSVAIPAFVKEPGDPFGAGSVIAVADSAPGADSPGGSFVGRVSASGELSFAPLTAGGEIRFDPPEATGLPAPPLGFALGGAKRPSGPPDGALVGGGNGPHTAVMLTKNTDRFGAGSVSETKTLPTGGGDCQLATPPRDASVTPTTTGSSGAGNMKFCWIRKNNDGTLSVFSARGGAILDARWGQENNVAFRGVQKSARVDADGIPQFADVDSSQPARPGADADSGGLSVTGITSPDVRDATYGPGGASDIALGLNTLVVASKNGGAEGSFKELLPRGRGSRAVAWWQGDGRSWLLFGHLGCTRMLSAFVNYDAGSAPLAEPNVNGSSCADLGGAGAGGPPGESYQVQTLEPVPGTDMVFIGVASGINPQGGGGVSHLWRGRLQPGGGSDPPSLVDLVTLDPPSGTSFSPGALEYCPTSPGFPEQGGVLFAAGGPLLRIKGASGTPEVRVVDSVSGAADVRADCATGVVYVGASGGSGGGSLFKSTDGGNEFLRVPTGAPGQLRSVGPVGAVGLNPADPNDVKVATAGGGTIQHSADGGGLWTLVNDPEVDRTMNVNDIEYPPGGGPGIPGLPRVAASPGLGFAAVKPPALALLATGGGLFQGAIAAHGGVLAVRAAGDSAQVSNLPSDSDPTLAVARAQGVARTVFRRPNGLYHSISTAGRSWSIPDQVPGTTAADDFPATAVDGAGRLHLAFARNGKGSGIYVMRTESTGLWSAPKRVSSGAGDTLPAIVLTGSAGKPTVDVAFLRTRGRSRGVYHASGKGTRWRRAARIPGTGAADARAALGAPSLETDGRRFHLAFARTGRASGIVYALRVKSRWGALRRLTAVRGDAQPTLAVDARGLPRIAFRRTKGERGLLVLRGGRKWTLGRVRGTSSRDTEPALAIAGSELILAFARPAGKSPGVHYTRARGSGRWLRKPQRWSGDARDRDPSAETDGSGGLTIVFERG
jgi:hypothetical protein